MAFGRVRHAEESPVFLLFRVSGHLLKLVPLPGKHFPLSFSFSFFFGSNYLMYSKI